MATHANHVDDAGERTRDMVSDKLKLLAATWLVHAARSCVNYSRAFAHTLLSVKLAAT